MSVHIRPYVEQLHAAAPQDRIAAIEALGKEGEHAAAAIPLLVEMLNDDGQYVLGTGDHAEPILMRVRKEAARALVKIGYLAVPALIGALENEKPDVRAQAAMALGETQDRRATRALVSLLADKVYAVREAALIGLASMKDPAAIEPVIKTIEGGDKEPLVDAGRALYAMTGQDFGQDVGKWRQWLKDHPPAAEKPTVPLGNTAGTEFAVLAAKAVAVEVKKGTPPEGWGWAGFMPRIIERLKVRKPDFLQTTAAEEEAFAAGRFNDAAARARLSKALAALGDAPGELPWLKAYVAERAKAGDLVGGRLEAAARVMEAEAATPPPAVEKPAAEKPAPPTAADEKAEDAAVEALKKIGMNFGGDEKAPGKPVTFATICMNSRMTDADLVHLAGLQAPGAPAPVGRRQGHHR